MPAITKVRTTGLRATDRTTNLDRLTLVRGPVGTFVEEVGAIKALRDQSDSGTHCGSHGHGETDGKANDPPKERGKGRGSVWAIRPGINCTVIVRIHESINETKLIVD